MPGFAVEEHVESRLAVQTDRWTWLAFSAAREAFADAGVVSEQRDPYSMSVVLASSSGGNVFGQRELQRLWSAPARTVSAYQSIAWFYAATVGQLSIKHQLKGPSNVLVTEAAGGLDSVAHAARTVLRGTPLVLAGGTEAPLSPYALVCQQRSGQLSTGTDPGSAYLPFQADARGHVPGEGGAVLVVEDREHAQERGMRGAPVVAGWAATHDGATTTRRGGPPPQHYAAAMRLALGRAGVAPSDVDLVFVDALGLPAHDRSEVAALRLVFGPSGPRAVTTQKPLVGRLYQGGAALDVATAVLAMRRGVIPPAAVGTAAPGLELAFVREPVAAAIDTVLVIARGFDGFNSAVVLRRDEEAPT